MAEMGEILNPGIHTGLDPDVLK